MEWFILIGGYQSLSAIFEGEGVIFNGRGEEDVQFG